MHLEQKIAKKAVLTFFTSLCAISSIIFRFSASLAGYGKPLMRSPGLSCNKGNPRKPSKESVHCTHQNNSQICFVDFDVNLFNTD